MAEKPNIGAGDIEQTVRDVIRVFRRTRIPYMLVGALALSAWGRPRATLDIDFMILADAVPANLVTAMAALEPMGTAARDHRGIELRDQSNRKPRQRIANMQDQWASVIAARTDPARSLRAE